MEQPIRVDRADLDKATDLLVQVFLDDPLYRFLFRNEAQRPSFLGAALGMSVRMAHVHGEALATSPAFEGVSVWIAPGQPKEEDGQQTIAVARFTQALLRLNQAERDRILGYMGHAETVRKKLVPGLHWNFALLGVAPEHRGKGLAGCLINPMLARIDAEGLPCYLETETEANVALHRKYGFEVVHEEDLPENGPRFWAMVRQPRNSG